MGFRWMKSIMHAMAFLTSKDKIIDGFRQASIWVFTAIDAVRSAPDNTYGSDEEIAGEILRRIEERRKA